MVAIRKVPSARTRRELPILAVLRGVVVNEGALVCAGVSSGASAPLQCCCLPRMSWLRRHPRRCLCVLDCHRASAALLCPDCLIKKLHRAVLLSCCQACHVHLANLSSCCTVARAGYDPINAIYYALLDPGGVAAMDTKTGKLLWQKPFAKQTEELLVYALCGCRMSTRMIHHHCRTRMVMRMGHHHCRTFNRIRMTILPHMFNALSLLHFDRHDFAVDQTTGMAYAAVANLKSTAPDTWGGYIARSVLWCPAHT